MFRPSPILPTLRTPNAVPLPGPARLAATYLDSRYATAPAVVPAVVALDRARSRLASDPAGCRFPPTGSRLVRSGGMSYVESPAAFGLRFVGTSADLAGKRHTGWYTHPDGDPDETAFGVVYQLPARSTRPQYVAGYAYSWSPDMPVLDLRTVFIGRRRGNGDDARRDAARMGDEHTRVAAESDRACNEASAAGLRYADLLDEERTLRRAVRDLVRDLLPVRRAGRAPNIVTAVESLARGELNRIAKSQLARADLVAAWDRPGPAGDAFRSAAGLDEESAS